jgi:hypothetical protein
LVGAYAVDRRQGAVEDVVEAVVATGLFNGVDVRGLFHDAEQAGVAGGIGAIAARVNVGDVVAKRAEAEVLAKRADGGGKGFGFRIRGAQNVKSEALCGLGADAGKFAELVDETGHWFCEASGHRAREKRSRAA